MNKTNELGSVNKSFMWLYKNDVLTIQKSLKASNNKMTFTKEELEKIIDYIGDEGHAYVANDIGKIAAGREKEGVGQFIYDKIDRDLSKAQYAAHLMAIFMEQAIVEVYGHKRDLTFALKRPDYVKNLITDES